MRMCSFISKEMGSGLSAHKGKLRAAVKVLQVVHKDGKVSNQTK